MTRGTGTTGRGPLIGLSAYCETAQHGAWQEPSVLLPSGYVEQVQAVGGIPVVLPPVAGIPDVVASLDGLVLTGGGDIDPARYGAPADPRTGGVSHARDEAELGLLAAALATGLPVLGICRGVQLINVAFGGTLCQHVDNAAGHTPSPGTYGSHRVRIGAGTRLAAILQDGEADVPTAHHQGIDRLGKGLTAAAWTSDGLTEAVEACPLGSLGDQFLLAVQWHPEAGTDLRLMGALVAAASARAQLTSAAP